MFFAVRVKRRGRGESVFHVDRNALFAIEECFVNGDTDGIAAIRKKAEENAELSVWNKVRIFNECTSALADSKLGGRLAPV